MFAAVPHSICRGGYSCTTWASAALTTQTTFQSCKESRRRGASFSARDGILKEQSLLLEATFERGAEGDEFYDPVAAVHPPTVHPLNFV